MERSSKNAAGADLTCLAGSGADFAAVDGFNASPDTRLKHIALTCAGTAFPGASAERAVGCDFTGPWGADGAHLETEEATDGDVAVTASARDARLAGWAAGVGADGLPARLDAFQVAGRASLDAICAHDRLPVTAFTRSFGARCGLSAKDQTAAFNA